MQSKICNIDWRICRKDNASSLVSNPSSKSESAYHKPVTSLEERRHSRKNMGPHYIIGLHYKLHLTAGTFTHHPHYSHSHTTLTTRYFYTPPSLQALSHTTLTTGTHTPPSLLGTFTHHPHYRYSHTPPSLQVLSHTTLTTGTLTHHPHYRYSHTPPSLQVLSHTTLTTGTLTHHPHYRYSHTPPSLQALPSLKYSHRTQCQSQPCTRRMVLSQLPGCLSLGVVFPHDCPRGSRD